MDTNKTNTRNTKDKKTGIKIRGDTIIVYNCQGCEYGIGRSVCGACRTTKYCSRQCQKSDWKRHKHDCDSLKLKRCTRKGKKGAEKVFRSLGEDMIFPDKDEDGDEESELSLTLCEYHNKLFESYRFRRDQFPDILPGLMQAFIEGRLEHIPGIDKTMTNHDLKVTKYCIRKGLEHAVTQAL